MVPPNGGRSIRNIPIPNARKESPRIIRENPLPSKLKNSFKMPRISSGSWRIGGPKKLWWWAGGAVGIIIIAFVVMSFMSGARIEITPKVVKASSQDLFNAFKADSVPSEKTPTNALPFQVVTVSKTGGKTVKANGEEQVQKKASGTLLIYNDYGTVSQRLIKNTRFESPEGLVFRISDSVVVPGQKTVEGKKVPGSVEALVYADEPGEKYNIGLTDFTIPGFKGDPRFKAMYARSKTPMSGGFVGMVKKVADEDRMVAENEIENALKTDLLKSVKSQIPASMVVLSGLEKTVFVPGEQSEPSGNTVKLNTTGTVTAVIADRAELGNFLASHINDVRNISVSLSNPDNLSFSIKDNSKFDPARDQTFQFSVDGEMVFIGQVENDSLIDALVGKPKSDLQVIKSAFPAIDLMKVSVLPPWSSNLPTEPKDFTIVVNKGVQ